MENNRELINRLSKEIENKENRIINLSDDRDDLELDKKCLLEKIDELQQVIENKDLTICELNVKLVRESGKLDKIQNYIRMTEGREFK